MNLSKEDILSIMEKAKDLGFNTIKVDGLELQSSDKKIAPPQDLPDDIIKKMYPKVEELTDDEILFWSTDYGLELEAMRLGKKKEE